MNPELARRILTVKQKLATAKAQVEFHTKMVAAASDELLQILSDPSVEAALTADTMQPAKTVAIVTPVPGIRDISSGRVVATAIADPAIVGAE
jgi:hypothetical protein